MQATLLMSLFTTFLLLLPPPLYSAPAVNTINWYFSGLSTATSPADPPCETTWSQPTPIDYVRCSNWCPNGASNGVLTDTKTMSFTKIKSESITCPGGTEITPGLTFCQKMSCPPYCCRWDPLTGACLEMNCNACDPKTITVNSHTHGPFSEIPLGPNAGLLCSLNTGNNVMTTSSVLSCNCIKPAPLTAICYDDKAPTFPAPGPPPAPGVSSGGSLSVDSTTAEVCGVGGCTITVTWRVSKTGGACPPPPCKTAKPPTC
jgi:hypothetical protein